MTVFIVLFLFCRTKKQRNFGFSGIVKNTYQLIYYPKTPTVRHCNVSILQKDTLLIINQLSKTQQYTMTTVV